MLILPIMNIIVQKFGGTSVADTARLEKVANIIKAELDSGNAVIAVVSAMVGVTNSLISKCNALSPLNSAAHMREYDAALASGEVVTSALLALQLQKIGIKAQSLQGWQIPLKTDGTHGNAQITEASPALLKDMLAEGITPVITGFQGIAPNGAITTLGKGGSDTSAAIIAASLEASRCDIYTDVEGIYTADPRVVHDAKKIGVINIDELYALCINGAKILHPRAALAAKRYGFPIRILSSFTDNTGTVTQIEKLDMENKIVKAITSNKNLLKVNVEYQPRQLSGILQKLSEESIEIEQIYNSCERNSSIITNLTDKNKCKKLLDSLKSASALKEYSLNSNISTVTMVGYGIKSDTKLTWKIMDVLMSNDVQVLSVHSSDVTISMLINDADNEKTIKLLHDYCF
ncbi:MAG: aspartate kinase [Rickettsiales bacterium]|nr:MAG: aspartate kinase [Rickettsiales bacterium]